MNREIKNSLFDILDDHVYDKIIMKCDQMIEDDKKILAKKISDELHEKKKFVFNTKKRNSGINRIILFDTDEENHSFASSYEYENKIKGTKFSFDYLSARTDNTNKLFYLYRRCVWIINMVICSKISELKDFPEIIEYMENCLFAY